MSLTYTEILSWSLLRRIKLDAWELDALIRLDAAYLAAVSSADKGQPNVD